MCHQIEDIAYFSKTTQAKIQYYKTDKLKKINHFNKMIYWRTLSLGTVSNWLAFYIIFNCRSNTEIYFACSKIKTCLIQLKFLWSPPLSRGKTTITCLGVPSKICSLKGLYCLVCTCPSINVIRHYVVFCNFLFCLNSMS